MVLNGAILSVVIIGVYLFALIHYCDGQILQAEMPLGYETGLKNAQTVAFISLVFSENVRSYTSRSFDQPIWVNLCGNASMQKAILLAQVAMLCAVMIPFFSEDILSLRGRHIGAWGWGVSFAGPLGTLILCELSKLITKYQMKQHQNKLAKKAAADDAAAKELESKPAVPVDTPPRQVSGKRQVSQTSTSSNSNKAPVLRSSSFCKASDDDSHDRQHSSSGAVIRNDSKGKPTEEVKEESTAWI